MSFESFVFVYFVFVSSSHHAVDRNRETNRFFRRQLSLWKQWAISPVCVWIICIHISSRQQCRSLLFCIGLNDRLTLYGATLQCLPIQCLGVFNLEYCIKRWWAVWDIIWLFYSFNCSESIQQYTIFNFFIRLLFLNDPSFVGVQLICCWLWIDFVCFLERIRGQGVTIQELFAFLAIENCVWLWKQL